MSSKQSTGQDEEQGPTIPRAIIHKQILDAAVASPDASIEALADEVSGASGQLVERILDEYGDPAATEAPNADVADQGRFPNGPVDEDPGTTEDGAVESMAEAEETPLRSEVEGTPPTSWHVPSPSQITEKQRELLATIYEHPDATQRDLGAILGVSGATISVHANSIPGFEWEHRGAFSAAFVEATDASAPDHHEPEGREPTDADDQSELRARIKALEKCANEPSTGLGDPDLTHRIVHACMSSEHITEAEELTIIQLFMYDKGPTDDQSLLD